MTLALRRTALAFVAVLGLAAVSLAAVPASAQELAPEHLALARKYVDLTDKSAIYEVTIVNAGIQTEKQFIQQNPEILKQLDDAITATIDEYKGRKDELMDQFARVYASRLTMDELQKIVEFYSTPAGKKLAEVNFEANQDLAKVLQVFQNNLAIEFVAKVRARLKAEGIDV
jgi:hypothetical protein